MASVPLPLAPAPARAPGEWALPSMSLLQASKKLRQDQRQIDALGEDLVRALAAARGRDPAGRVPGRARR